ncbi:universal stress protein [Azohydromonas caseinilytica]|uniref:Universal stress protein n=1 Tax=Azohydromonas caseinilytica TaxID=2728836 RepID=A0A848FC05_9BURK|nr:universal stress protein [Azohydromonas caseinilytica]NML16848.1 universal stress protein [Azohydromonas caseinilytica]
MFRSILVAVDASHAAHNAVRRAGLLAARFEARLTLLQVLAPSVLRLPYGLFAPALGTDARITRAQLALGRAAAGLARDHDIHASVVVRVGDALEHIRLLAHEADLLVVGAKTRNPLHDSVLGTRAARLMQLARHAVLVVKSPAASAYSRVLVPTDFADCSEAALRLALKMVSDRSVEVFHALSTHRETRMRAANVPAQAILDYVGSAREKCLRRLRAATALANGHAAGCSVGHGDPACLSLERQKAMAADLIVMGREGQGQSVAGGMRMGSVARQLVAKAGCDVLFIPRTALPYLEADARPQRPAMGFDALASRRESEWMRREAAPMSSACHDGKAFQGSGATVLPC